MCQWNVITSVCDRSSNLSSSCHLSQQILHDHVRQHLQQHVTRLRVSVQPALGLGVGVGAPAFDHVGHQRPLWGEEEETPG